MLVRWWALRRRVLGSGLDFGPFCLDFQVCLGFLTASVDTLFPHPQKHVYYVNHQCPWPWHWLMSASGPIQADTGEMERSYFTNNRYILFYICRFLLKIIFLFCVKLWQSSCVLISAPFAFKSICCLPGCWLLILVCPCASHSDTHFWPLSFFSAFCFISLLDIWSRIRNNLTSVTVGILETVG